MDGYYTASSRGQYEKTRVVLFCVLIDFDFVSAHKNAQKKQELGQYQATLTSDLVNNVYMLFKGIIWKHRWYHCGVP